MLLRCCRKPPKEDDELDLEKPQKPAHQLIEEMGEQLDRGAARAFFAQLLKVLDMGLDARGTSSTEALAPDVQQVLLACGYKRNGHGGLDPPPTMSSERQAMSNARELVWCLVLSFEEEGVAAPPAGAAAPAAVTPRDLQLHIRQAQQPVSPDGEGGEQKGPTSGDVASEPASSSTATPGGSGSGSGGSGSSAPDRPDSAVATAPPSDAGGATPGSAGGGASDNAAVDDAGAGPSQTPSPSSPDANGDASGASPGGPRSDREVAEALAREDQPKVLTFQRFKAEDVVIDPAVVEEINRQCRETGERYVDPQFPPIPRSIYLSDWEAESWECLSCHTRTKLPPVPPLPKSKEEAQQQEQDFKNKVKCDSCGGCAPYVVQVRYFTRPTQWLHPAGACNGCEMVYGHLPGGRELAQQMCTHFLRDAATNVTVGLPWKLIREAARPEDVCQGGLGNCWFAAALSMVASRPELIDRLFFTKDFNPHGVYHMQLCHGGEWRGIVLDDLFPTSQVFEGYVDNNMIYYSRGGTLCYLGGARRQLWVPLVEKAAAKLFGCYGSLKGGTFGEALAFFTGCPTERIRLYVPKALRRMRAERRDARNARRTQALLQGMEVAADDNEDSGEDDDLTWSKLLSCKDAGYLMGVGCTEEGCEKTKQYIVEEMGLQSPHAYGILDVREATVDGQIVRFLKIRNPWGERAPRTWKGAWGKDSEKWTPELQRELGIVNSSGVPMDDPMSIFWMAYEDAKEFFAHVEVCRIHIGWHEARQRVWLPSGVGPGEALDLTVFQKTSIDVAVWQERHISREGAVGARSTNVDIGLAILRSRGVEGDGRHRFELIEYVSRSPQDDVSGEIILEGGYMYRLVPICFGLLQEPAPRCASVVVHSVHPIELSKAASSWYDIACATFEAARKSGKHWADRGHLGVTYWLIQEPGGCALVAENRSDVPIAIQADASDSIGCSCSRGDLGTVARVQPNSRQVVMALAYSPGAAYTRASILPQPVPLELAPPAEADEVESLHLSLPLLPDDCRRGPPPPPSQTILQRAREGAAPPPTSSRAQAPATPAAAVAPSAPSPAVPAAPAIGQTSTQPSSPPAAPATRSVSGDYEDDLAAALRLSLTATGGATRVVSPPASRMPAGPLTEEESKRWLEARVKELFAAFRAQGMAPHEAATRAGDEARQQMRQVAVAAS